MAFAKCKDIFSKNEGLRILMIDFYQTQRIRKKVDVERYPKFIGIHWIQLEKGVAEQADLESEEVQQLFDFYYKQSLDLMTSKNHDYGEAWRDMRVSSLTDLILQKLLRIKQIEDNKGKTLISEGVDANYYDMINYSIFALIKLN